MFKNSHLRYFVLPLLVAAYPVLFLYAHNALVLPLSSLTLPLVTALLVAALIFGLFYALQRSLLSASLAASLFMVLFYLYGFIYDGLVQWDKFHVENFVLFPVLFALGIYFGYLLKHLKPGLKTTLQKVLTVVATVLVVFNLTVAIPVEAKKIQTFTRPKISTAKPANSAKASGANTSATGAAVSANGATVGATDTQKRPDIYYFILDEYVAFQPMRDYWHNNDVDQFQAFLNQNHFFVAPQSQSPTINTLTEMASRLNLHQYQESDPQDVQLNALDKNKVMQVLKSYGYTTVVLNMAFQGINADENIPFDPTQISGMAAEQYRTTLINQSMFRAFNRLIQSSNSAAVRQRDLLFYALDKTADLPEAKSPKFVYTHLLLPHTPFIFDKNGSLLPPQDAEDWHYYLGQYQYSTQLAEQLITRLLANADPNNPPVIILQSDEGARNIRGLSPDKIAVNGYLPDYPEAYYRAILNALYLPGYDTSQLPADLPPIQTFPLILNYYLNAGISVDNAGQ